MCLACLIDCDDVLKSAAPFASYNKGREQATQDKVKARERKIRGNRRSLNLHFIQAQLLSL